MTPRAPYVSSVITFAAENTRERHRSTGTIAFGWSSIQTNSTMAADRERRHQPDGQGRHASATR